MSASLETPAINRCLVCDAAPIPDGLTYCSELCYRADHYTCDICGTFTAYPSQHRRDVHPETVEVSHEERDPDATAVEPRGPVMYGEVETELQSDPRECNDCGERVSASYARIFARENGDLWCSDCRARSERYSNDPSYGPDHESDPSTLTGSSNPRSTARSENRPTSPND